MFTSCLKRVVTSVLLVTWAVTEVASTQCVAAPSAHLTINVNYNETGHWLATLRLAKETSLDATNPRSASGLLLDVQPSSTRCGTIRTDALTVKLQGSPPPLGPGFEEVPGFGLYKVHPELINWEEAKLVCEAESSHLLILNSEAEATAIQNLLKKSPNIKDYIHVGFHDKIKEGNYVTIFGQPLAATGFTRWNAGEPTDNNSENCGSVRVSSMGLNDLTCTTYKFPFVCEAFL